MKIISWNVNSVRARIENVLNYIKESKPDILLLQEIKTQKETFPTELFKNGRIPKNKVCTTIMIALIAWLFVP